MCAASAWFSTTGQCQISYRLNIPICTATGDDYRRHWIGSGYMGWYGKTGTGQGANSSHPWSKERSHIKYGEMANTMRGWRMLWALVFIETFGRPFCKRKQGSFLSLFFNFFVRTFRQLVTQLLSAGFTGRLLLCLSLPFHTSMNERADRQASAATGGFKAESEGEPFSTSTRLPRSGVRHD